MESKSMKPNNECYTNQAIVDLDIGAAHCNDPLVARVVGMVHGARTRQPDGSLVKDPPLHVTALVVTKREVQLLIWHRHRQDAELGPAHTSYALTEFPRDMEWENPSAVEIFGRQRHNAFVQRVLTLLLDEQNTLTVSEEHRGLVTYQQALMCEYIIARMPDVVKACTTYYVTEQWFAERDRTHDVAGLEGMLLEFISTLEEDMVHLHMRKAHNPRAKNLRRLLED